ncbi:MAG: NHL repeat-containing protein [bacterium]
MKSKAYLLYFLFFFILITANGVIGKEKSEPEIKPIGYYNYQLFKSFGKYGRSRGYFDNPTDMAIDISENALYIVDKGNERIQKFDCEGDYITYWDYEDLKRDSRKVEDFFEHFNLILPKNNREIEPFTTENKLFERLKFDKIEAITIPNSSLFKERNIFLLQATYNYTDIALDRNDNLYIIANKTCTILKFKVSLDIEGKIEYIDSFGGFGSGDGYFYSPTKIAFDSSKFMSIWVLDSKDGKLHNFDLNGEFLKAFIPKDKNNKTLKKPQDLCIDNHGFIFISDKETHRIYKYNNEGLYIQSIGKEGDNTADFKDPSALSVDNEGRLFVLDTGNNRIQIFKP